MLLSHSQSLQLSPSLHAPRLPVPGMRGSFRLGPIERDRLGRQAGESALMDCNHWSTNLMARLTWDCANGTWKSRWISCAISVCDRCPSCQSR